MSVANIVNLVFAAGVGAFVGWDLFDAGVSWWTCATIGGVVFLAWRTDWGELIRGKHFDD